MAHIFVVDDDEQLLRMVGLMLERGGHTATLVSNPIEALDMIQEDVPDLAILDVMMPGMNGLELCEALRSNPATLHLPIIILTARGPIEDREEALEIGADSYLNKPVTSLELLSNVDELLESAVSTDTEDADSNNDNTPPPETIEVNAPVSPERCQAIAVYGFSGGAGRTTLAVNLAMHLNKQFPGKVCLVDLTTSGGQAAMQLRLQPNETWFNLIGLGDFSGLQIGKQVVEHSSGLRILPAPAMPTAPENLSISAAKKIYSTLSANNRFVIFDLAPVFTPVVKFVLNKVDWALHVVRPEVMAVQTAIRVEKRMNTKGPMPTKKFFVMNQSSPDAKLEQSTVERGLGAKIDFTIGYDKLQAKAVLQGVPLASGSGTSPIPTGVSQIAEKVTQSLAVPTP